MENSETTVDVTLTLPNEKSQDIKTSENCSKAEELEQEITEEENGIEISDSEEEDINEVVIEDVLETEDNQFLEKDEIKQVDEKSSSDVEITEVDCPKIEVVLKDQTVESAPTADIQLNEESVSQQNKEELPAANSLNSVQKSDKMEFVNSKQTDNEVVCKDDDEETKVSQEGKVSSENDIKVTDEKAPEDIPKAEKPIQENPQVEAVNVSSKTNTGEVTKHEIINNTIREIISDIDTNIKEDENILQLKQEEMDLLKKHEELTRQIQQQQMLADKLAAENRQQFEELERKNLELKYQKLQQQQNEQFLQSEQKNKQLPQSTESQFCKLEQSRDETSTCSTDFYKSVESCSESKKQVDLSKIFTPATDNVDILPKNRKLYASSAFYSPSLHPTVEDQVELARRISHSLSDISNQTSKGQSMYDNRKKRSVKWVHESIGQGTTEDIDHKENAESESNSSNRLQFEKIPLKLVMNPRGQIIDFNSVHESLNTKTGLLSPDKCAQLVSALQTQKGKGAELFAKRRKKVDKWIIDETNAGSQTPSGIPDHHQMQSPKPPTSPSILPAYSEAGKHRVQLNMHQEQLLEKYAQPSIMVVKTPWEAALETGSASAAFMEDSKSYSLPKPTMALPQGNVQQYTDTNSSQYEAPKTDISQPYLYSADMNQKQNKVSNRHSASYSTNSQRDLAYKPSIPQGWNAPSVTLPKHMYVPKEIPLENYAPPPAVAEIQSRPSNNSSYFPAQREEKDLSNSFGVSMPSAAIPQRDESSWYGGSPHFNKSTPHVNFSPSPLSHEKLSKYQNNNNNMQTQNLNAACTRVLNSSPAPFGQNTICTSYTGQINSQSSSNCQETKIPPRSQSRFVGNIQNKTNFNNSARGWGYANNNSKCTMPMQTGSFKRGFPVRSQVGQAVALPFTDF